jgi:alginate O-acetyltransferase complex protein AlgI
VLITWVFFRADGLPHAVHYLACMFGGADTTPFAPLLKSEIYQFPNFLDMTLCAILVIQPLQSYEFGKSLSWGKFATAFSLFLFAVVMMYTQAFNPFLYFQF